MVRNYIKRGPKGSHDFCLTINGIDCPKSVIGDWFAKSGDFSAVCVAEEEYHAPFDCDTGVIGDSKGVHQHCFLRSNDAMLLDDLREIILTLTDDIGFDLQVCKSRKSWLIYISKEDYFPYMFNVRVSELSLYARAQHHIKNKYRRPDNVDKADYFMVAAGNFRNVCIDMANKHMDDLREKVQMERPTLEPNMSCWLVRSIYNRFLKGEHLYIYGLPGLGKTELIDRLISKKKVWKAGANDRFMFGTLHEGYEIILFEDFKPFDHEKYLSTTLSIMDKKPVTLSEKGKNDCTKMFNAQVIFVSNETIPSCMSMLERRVQFFCVDHKMYDCVACLYFDI